MNGKESVQRGAAEESSESPLTETEVRSSQRPAGEGDQQPERRAEKKVDEEHDPEQRSRRRESGR